MDIAALAIPVSVLAFASFSLWSTRRKVLKRDAELAEKEKGRTRHHAHGPETKGVQGTASPAK